MWSFNPMSNPSDDWGRKFDATPELEHKEVGFDVDASYMAPGHSVPCVPSLSDSEEDDEVTESKIKAFLDEKALELKRLQTPLYGEFYNSLYTSCSPTSVPSVSDSEEDDEVTESKIKAFLDEKALELKKLQTPLYEEFYNSLYTSCSPTVINGTTAARKYLKLPASPPSLSLSERQRKWKEELDQELQRKREMLCQAQAGIWGKTSSPKDRALHRQRDRTRFASPSK